MLPGSFVRARALGLMPMIDQVSTYLSHVLPYLIRLERLTTITKPLGIHTIFT